MSKDRDFDKRKKFMMELLGDPVYQPMRFREIAGLLRLSKDEKKDLYRVLDDLVAEGRADLDSKGRYSKVTGRKRGKEKLHKRREIREAPGQIQGGSIRKKIKEKFRGPQREIWLPQ